MQKIYIHIENNDTTYGHIIFRWHLFARYKEWESAFLIYLNPLKLDTEVQKYPGNYLESQGLTTHTEYPSHQIHNAVLGYKLFQQHLCKHFYEH